MPDPCPPDNRPPVRIAFISHEFPPETGGGGIGTYLDQATRFLVQAGHSVEVFCGAASIPGTSTNHDGVRVHRIEATGALAFRQNVVPVFAAVHKTDPFDVMEGTDFDAPANDIKAAFPKLPYVVKLHTPRFVVDELHYRPPTRWQEWRMRLGAYRRGRGPSLPRPIREQPAALAEIAALVLADEIASPSQAIARAASQWVARAIADKISVFPYPYAPPAALLAIAPGGDSQRITFVGRLEERKGVIDLADAVPLVLAVHPGARFRFIGRSMTAPESSGDMRTYLQKRLGKSAAAVEFTGPVSPAEIPRLLAETDILAAPSHWESFGLVCCEGLAAARAVIGSSAGGMVEILDGGRCGELVPPAEPTVLADRIIRLLADADRRRRLGELGRHYLLEAYSVVRGVESALASYERAILHRPAASP